VTLSQAREQALMPGGGGFVCRPPKVQNLHNARHTLVAGVVLKYDDWYACDATGKPTTPTETELTRNGVCPDCQRLIIPPERNTCGGRCYACATKHALEVQRTKRGGDVTMPVLERSGRSGPMLHDDAGCPWRLSLEEEADRIAGLVADPDCPDRGTLDKRANTLGRIRRRAAEIAPGLTATTCRKHEPVNPAQEVAPC